MKKQFKHCAIVVVVLILLSNSKILAQTGSYTEDFKQINRKIGTHRNSYVLTYNLFENYQSTKLLESQQLQVRSFDLMINISNPHFQIIKNKEHYLYINHDKKVLMINSVTSYTSQFKQLKEMERLINLDTLIKNHYKVKDLGIVGKSKAYRLMMKDDPNYSYCDIIFDPHTFILQKIILYYSKTLKTLGIDQYPLAIEGTPRMEMIFSQFEESKRFNKDSFSLKNIVSISSSKATPAREYSKYKFIDNRLN